LNDEHGGICPSKGAQVIKPVVKRATPIAFGVSACFMHRRPEQEKDGLAFKEKGVRTVIDFLTAEVPEVQPYRVIETLQSDGRVTELDATERYGNEIVELDPKGYRAPRRPPGTSVTGTDRPVRQVEAILKSTRSSRPTLEAARARRQLSARPMPTGSHSLRLNTA
jgi:hypothetical protein